MKRVEHVSLTKHTFTRTLTHAYSYTNTHITCVYVLVVQPTWVPEHAELQSLLRLTVHF